jgi:anti-sigma factor RsiW
MTSNLDIRDPRVLDRLVDGELTDEEEREVLLQLEQDPRGWRRCALAFLEARCWQREMGRVRQHVGADCLGARLTRLDQEQRLAATRPPGKRGWGVWALTVAATFVLAFSVGRLLPNSWNQDAAPAMLAQPKTQDSLPQTLVARPSLPETEAMPAASFAAQNGPIGNLTLVDSTGREFAVPVYDWEPGKADQIIYGSSPLPPDLLRGLQRHQVRQYQRYVPVKLGDGRQVVVPVQELDIVRVRPAAY